MHYVTRGIFEISRRLDVYCYSFRVVTRFFYFLIGMDNVPFAIKVSRYYYVYDGEYWNFLRSSLKDILAPRIGY